MAAEWPDGERIVPVHVKPTDDLVWEPARDLCVSRSLGVPVYFEAGRWAVPLPCCNFKTLLVAEWWRVYRALADLPQRNPSFTSMTRLPKIYKAKVGSRRSRR